MNNNLQSGYSEAKEITKKFAKTFYYASKFLPKNKQNASYAIYAICRISDNAIDDNDQVIHSLKQIEQIRSNIASIYTNNNATDNLLAVFKETIKQYNIPKEYFDELIAGLRTDLEKSSYPNFKELYQYCYRVAGVIGLIMLKIFGYKNAEAEKHAVNLGIAMQLTNILRDVKEDYQRGRIYLPLKEMDKFGVTEESISGRKIDESFLALMKFQIARARNYYEEARKGLKFIPEKSSRLVVCLMQNIYAAILDKIEQHHYDVFKYRAHTNLLDKITLTVKTLNDKSLKNEN